MPSSLQPGKHWPATEETPPTSQTLKSRSERSKLLPTAKLRKIYRNAKLQHLVQQYSVSGIQIFPGMEAGTICPEYVRVHTDVNEHLNKQRNGQKRQIFPTSSPYPPFACILDLVLASQGQRMKGE